MIDAVSELFMGIESDLGIQHALPRDSKSRSDRFVPSGHAKTVAQHAAHAAAASVRVPHDQCESSLHDTSYHDGST